MNRIFRCFRIIQGQHRFLTLAFELIRFWLRIRGYIHNRKSAIEFFCAVEFLEKLEKRPGKTNY
jgi:hypothetical protein